MLMVHPPLGGNYPKVLILGEADEFMERSAIFGSIMSHLHGFLQEIGILLQLPGAGRKWRKIVSPE